MTSQCREISTSLYACRTSEEPHLVLQQPVGEGTRIPALLKDQPKGPDLIMMLPNSRAPRNAIRHATMKLRSHGL